MNASSGDIKGAKKSPAMSAAIILLVVALGAGMAAAGSHRGAEAMGLPVFALVVAWIFLVQIIAFIPAWLKQTETFFDLTGSLTYVTAAIGGVALSGHTDAVSLLLAGAVTLWALRLGSFLFTRVRRSGSDDRFDEIKPNFPRFLTVWIIQALWVTITLSAALAAITAGERPTLGALTVVGLLLWLAGFVFEIVADLQKSRFRAEPANKGEFIRTGLWSWSRHPNYFGEIVLWVGIAIAAIPALSGWQYMSLISPLFVIVLLTRISGIPLLERKADERWGDQPAYQAFKEGTSILVPLPPRAARS